MLERSAIILARIIQFLIPAKNHMTKLDKNIQEQKISINSQEIIYQLKRSRRAKRIRLAIKNNGCITLTMPHGVSEGQADKFIKSKADWLLAKIKYYNQLEPTPIRTGGRKEYLLNRGRAMEFVRARADELNHVYRFKINRITIKNQ